MESRFSEMILRVEHAASVIDLDEITRDLIENGIHSVAMVREGSELIGKLVDAAYRVGRDGVAEAIFKALILDRARIIPVLQQKLGFNVLVLVSDFCCQNDELAKLLLQGSLFVTLLKTTEDDKSLAAFLFEHNVSSSLLDALLRTMTTNIVDLAATKRSASSICTIISSAKGEFNSSFFDLIQNHLLSLCKSREGNRIVQSMISFSSELSDSIHAHLSGQIVSLSTTAYASYVVKRLFDAGSVLSVRRTYHEIVNGDALDLLICDRFGNEVVQSLVRRLKSLNPTLFDFIASHVFLKASELEIHPFGVHVLRECRILVVKRM